MSVGNCIIDFLLANAQYHDAVFQEDTLNGLEPEARQYLIDAGMLVRTGELASHVYEDGEPVKIQVMYGSAPQRHFFIDGGDFIDVPVSRLKIYAIDYGPLAQLVWRDFKAKKEVKKVIPGKLWKCGNYGRQQRELFLSRNAGSDANIAAYLNDQPNRSVVLQLGILDDSLVKRFSEAQVGTLADMLIWKDDGLAIDMDIAEARISALQNEQDVKISNTGKKYLMHMDTIKTTLLGTFRLHLENARRARRGEPMVPYERARKRVKHTTYRYEHFVDQKTLSEATGVPESTVSEIRKEWTLNQNIEQNNTLLTLMDFLFSQKYDSESIFKFYDGWCRELQDAGLKDDYNS